MEEASLDLSSRKPLAEVVPEGGADRTPGADPFWQAPAMNGGGRKIHGGGSPFGGGMAAWGLGRARGAKRGRVEFGDRAEVVASALGEGNVTLPFIRPRNAPSTVGYSVPTGIPGHWGL